MDPDTQQLSDAEIPGVIARPPFLFLGALLLGLALDHLLPLPLTTPRFIDVRWIIGGSLILVGVAVFAASVRNFFHAKTPVQGTKPTKALVTSGIHGRSRNPIYLGMFLLYAGVGIVADSGWVLVLGLPLAITIHYGVVSREELYLERRFGEAYRDYRARVRRWF